MNILKNYKVTHISECLFHCRLKDLKRSEKEAYENVYNELYYECHICEKFVTTIKIDFVQKMKNVLM